MEKVLMILGGVLLAFLFVFFAPVLMTLLGAFGGWVVGLFFSETILGFLEQIGITGVKMWEVGASLGFLGGFFRSIHFSNNK